MKKCTIQSLGIFTINVYSVLERLFRQYLILMKIYALWNNLNNYFTSLKNRCWKIGWMIIDVINN